MNTSCPLCHLQSIFFTWELEENDELRCNYCGHIFKNPLKE